MRPSKAVKITALQKVTFAPSAAGRCAVGWHLSLPAESRLLVRVGFLGVGFHGLPHFFGLGFDGFLPFGGGVGVFFVMFHLRLFAGLDVLDGSAFGRVGSVLFFLVKDFLIVSDVSWIGHRTHESSRRGPLLVRSALFSRTPRGTRRHLLRRQWDGLQTQLLSAPEALWKLAGGASHRTTHCDERAPAGALENIGVPPPLPGRSRFHPLPGGLRHRLISVVPPAPRVGLSLAFHRSHRLRRLAVEAQEVVQWKAESGDWRAELERVVFMRRWILGRCVFHIPTFPSPRRSITR